MFIIIFGMVHYRAISCTWTCLSSETYVKQIIISRRIKRGACVFCLRLCECSQWSRKTALTSKGCCVEEKMDAYRLYSLCVAGGPRQPLGLLQDEDRSCDVIRRTLDLVWRQSQEVRSGVREFQRQIRAAGMVSVGATGHHTSHEIGYRRLHPREHGPAAAWVQAMRLRECHPTPHAPPSSSLPGRSPHGDADSRRGRKQNTQDPRKVIRHSDPSANTEIKAEQALSLTHTHRARLSCTAVMWQTGCCWWIWSLVAYLSEPLTVDSAGGQRCVIPMWRLPPEQGATQGFVAWEKGGDPNTYVYI